MTAVMVLGAGVLRDNGLNVLNLINLSGVARLVVVVPHLDASHGVIVDKPFAHFFFLLVPLCVVLAATFFPTLEKVIDCGTG